jgi:Tol biopolymer transport system component
VLVEAPASVTNLAPSSWRSDGGVIAYTLIGSRPLRADIWALPLSGERRPFPLMQTEHVETSGVLSPDGRWIALTTTEAGRANVYVQSYPDGRRRQQISADGGSHPVWRPDGKELFYLESNTTVMAVAMNIAGSPGTPMVLFSADVRASPSGSQVYAVTRDGNRFLVNARSSDVAAGPVMVVVNWTGGLAR